MAIVAKNRVSADEVEALSVIGDVRREKRSAGR
jgi:hypothetical protein